MQAAALHEHDLISGLELLPQDRASARWDEPDRAARKLDLLCGDESRQRRGLPAAPHRPRVDAGATPARHQRLLTVGVRVPVRRPRREVGVDHQRHRAHATKIVDDGRNRVVGDTLETLRFDQVKSLTSDDRLGAEALEHERERLVPDLEHERRLAAGSIDRASAERCEQVRGGERLGQRAALAGIKSVVVDAGGAVRGAAALRRWAHLRAGSGLGAGRGLTLGRSPARRRRRSLVGRR